MALLTTLSLAESQELARAYGLELARAEALVAGSVNSNFVWHDAAGTKYFARLYEEQGPSGARGEALLMEQLALAGVPVARPLRRLDGAELSVWQGKPFGVFSWVDGEWLCQGRVTAAHCRVLGAALARVHGAGIASQELGPGRFTVHALKERLASVRAAGRDDLVAAADHVVAQLDGYASRRDTTLPYGLIHGDLFRDNCLWRGDAIVALIDFESASHGSFLFDLLVTLSAWCFSQRFELDLARALVSSYHAARPLSRAEIAAVPVEGALACLRFAATRITDFSMRVPPGATPVRHYQRFLTRLEQLERGALSDVFAALPPR